MEQKIVKGMQRQLRGLADALGSGDEACDLMLMLQTGAFLMKGCAGAAEAAFEIMGDEAFGDAMDAVAMMARNISVLTGHTRCAASMEQSGQLAQLRHAGEAAGLHGKELKQAVQRQIDENEAFAEENRRMEAELQQLLRNRAEIAAENDEIEYRCTVALKNARELDERHRELESQWNEIDEETRRNASEIQRMESALERLRTNSEDFSPERQAQLRAEIAELEPQVDQARNKTNELTRLLVQLQESLEQYGIHEEQLKGDALDVVIDALESIEASTAEMQQRLEAAKRSADTQAQCFRICRDMYRDYASWLDANDSMLSELARVMGENDPLNNNLRSVMDSERFTRLRSFSETIRRDLEQMDTLLAPCIAIMSENRRVVLGKVTQGPGAKGGY